MTDQTGRATRVVRVPTWWLVVGVVTCLVSPILAVVVSVHVNNETIREGERQRTAQQAETRKVVCSLATTQLDAFSDAESDVGKASYRGWLDLYRLSKCQPER